MEIKMAKKEERIDPTVAQVLFKELGVPEDIELLSDIESRIEKNLLEYGRIKVEILKDLALIYSNRRFLFISDHNAKYLNDFASYIKDRFKQGRSTYYGDAKVVKMLVTHKEIVEEEEIFGKSKNDLVYLLRKISTVENPVPLLEDIDNYDRNSIEEELEKINADDPKAQERAKQFVKIDDLKVEVDAESKMIQVSFDSEDTPAEYLELLKKKIESLKGQKMKKKKAAS
jgi:hypothetical protein